MVRVGHIANARYVLMGVVTKTKSTYMLELAVTSAESGVRKASYPPKSVSPENLENLSAVNEASAEMLKQLGVTLTGAGLAELKKPMAVVQVQAQTALAYGVTAQKRGTEVAALSYYFQAAALDTSLKEATVRSSVISANISSGNIGADVRNEIAWRKAWVAKLTEAEEIFYKLVNTKDPPYALYYSTDLQQGTIDHQRERVDFKILANLRAADKAWTNSIVQSANAVYRELSAGLDATKKRTEWGLAGWPDKAVTKTSPFVSSPKIIFELLNDQQRVIGKRELEAPPPLRLSRDKKQVLCTFAEGFYNALPFYGVKADDITDAMTIRIASVNGIKPEDARLRITPLSGSKKQAKTFTDPRNGRKYKTVELYGMTWMAENLNFETGTSWCYENQSSNCNKYGRLYDWNTASKACPVGWHLPTGQEWNQLANFVGFTTAETAIPGTKLKSKAPGWDGTDEYGFSAIPGGERTVHGSFFHQGKFSYWWTADEKDDSSAYSRYISGSGVVESHNRKEGSGLSVRCVQD
jgi:uncharacterized protein (TIGR02145 family)